VDLIDSWELRAVCESRSVFTARDPARNLIRAVKTARDEREIQSLKRASAVLAGLNHPLILGFEGFVPSTANGAAALVSEFAVNGSLAEHLSEGVRGGLPLPSPTRVAVIVVGIAMAIRYLHSERLIHGDLNPATIFLGWDWTVRLSGFGCCLPAATSNALSAAASISASASTSTLHSDLRYTAPECFENAPTRRSDVFSFALILMVLVGGDADFWTELTPMQVMRRIVIDEDRPSIPASVDSRVRELIEDCWVQDPMMRPPFEFIVDRLKGMDFEVTPDVKSAKVQRFFESVEKREKALGLEVSDFV
jgi:serine/threonine protein kinase